jgi:hypothetical protein
VQQLGLGLSLGLCLGLGIGLSLGLGLGLGLCLGFCLRLGLGLGLCLGLGLGLCLGLGLGPCLILLNFFAKKKITPSKPLPRSSPPLLPFMIILSRMGLLGVSTKLLVGFWARF